jgi:hypothetical protein
MHLRVGSHLLGTAPARVSHEHPPSELRFLSTFPSLRMIRRSSLLRPGPGGFGRRWNGVSRGHDDRYPVPRVRAQAVTARNGHRGQRPTRHGENSGHPFNWSIAQAVVRSV